ncbi:MAG: hypothetical protein AB1813_19765 [Verrucomicrobiota bacterium]
MKACRGLSLRQSRALDFNCSSQLSFMTLLWNLCRELAAGLFTGFVRTALVMATGLILNWGFLLLFVIVASIESCAKRLDGLRDAGFSPYFFVGASVGLVFPALYVVLARKVGRQATMQKLFEREAKVVEAVESRFGPLEPPARTRVALFVPAAKADAKPDSSGVMPDPDKMDEATFRKLMAEMNTEMGQRKVEFDHPGEAMEDAVERWEAFTGRIRYFRILLVVNLAWLILMSAILFLA